MLLLLMICYSSLLNDYRSTYIYNYVLLTVTFHLNFMSCCDILKVICITVLNIYFKMLHLCSLFIDHLFCYKSKTLCLSCLVLRENHETCY